MHGRINFAIFNEALIKPVSVLMMIATVLSLVAVFSSGCGKSPEQKSSSKIVAFVSILPQKYFVDRIGGEYVDVHVLVGPGQSPETYEPTPRQMSALSEANVYFRIGVPFENFMAGRVSSTFKNLDIVDTQKGIKRRMITGHDHGHDSSGGSPDPHIWLAPDLVRIQAKTIEETLSKLSPGHASRFRENLARFDHDLDSVNAEIDSILAPYRGESIYAFHPAYGYFAAAYGLKQVSIEVGGKEPSAKQLSEVIGEMQQASNHVIFDQPQFSTKTAQTVADAIGGEVVPLDPLAEDYLTNLVQMARTIARVLPSAKTQSGDPGAEVGND